jgi:F0F1-type ATP synthase beta subunit
MRCLPRYGEEKFKFSRLERKKEQGEEKKAKREIKPTGIRVYDLILIK